MSSMYAFTRKKSSQHVRACAARDGAICSKNSKIDPHHRDNPNTRNSSRLRSPSPIMTPVKTQNRRPNNIQITSPQSYKTQIKILPYPGLA